MRLRSLRSDASGAAAVEFALVAPVLLVMVLGIFDLGYNMYTDALLQGAIQKAARDSTIDGASASETALDNQVRHMVQNIAPHATLTFQRTSYSNFSDHGRPEDWTDTNHNGSCDGHEPFEDANGNGSWDADRGIGGFGGARDAVLYEVTVVYRRPFPVAHLIGQPNTFTLVARTMLRNQPFDLQTGHSVMGNC